MRESGRSVRASAGRRRFSPGPRAGAVCALVSGGLDSAVLVGHLLARYSEVHPLYVRSGLHWERQEIAALRRYLRAVRTRRLRNLSIVSAPMADLYGDHWSTTGRGTPGWRAGGASVYLPGRNLALLAKAAVFCARRGIPVLVTGVLDSNPFPDATPAFFRAFEKAASLALDARLRIRAPYRGRGKDQVIRAGRGLPLALTLSCARPRGGRHCGVCTKCAERSLAFRRAGVPDPTTYAAGPAAAPRPSTGSAGRRSRTTRIAP